MPQNQVKHCSDSLKLEETSNIKLTQLKRYHSNQNKGGNVY